MFKDVSEDQDKWVYGMGEPSPYALQPSIKQCLDGPTEWNTHEVFH